MNSKKQDMSAGTGLILVSLLLYVYLIPTWVADSESGAMSPRFFPYIGTFLIGLGGAVLTITSFLARPTASSEISETETINPIKPMLIVIAMAVFVLVFQWFGYLYAAPLMIASMMVIFGCRNPIVIVLIATITTAVLFALFNYGLRLPLT